MVEKRVSVDQVFYNVFLEEMTKRGFILSKKYDMFLKLVDKEVLQYLALEKRTAVRAGKRAFSITGNMVSLYMESMDKKTLKLSSVRLGKYSQIRCGFEHSTPDIYEYDDSDCEVQMRAAMKDAEKVILPLYEQVTDLKTYVEFAKKYHISQIRDVLSFWADSLVLVKCDDHDDFLGILQDFVEWSYINELYIAQNVRHEPMPPKDVYKKNRYDEYYECLVTWSAGERDQVYNDPKLYKEALEEASRRKTANIEVLKALKLYKD